MDSEHSGPVEQLIELCGGYSRTVGAIMILGRAMWTLVFATDQSADYKSRNTSRIISEEHLMKELASLPTRVTALLLSHLRRKEKCWTPWPGQLAFALTLFQRMDLVREFLIGVRPDHEMQYFVRQNIRQHYDCTLSSRTSHLFHLLTNAVNSLSSDRSHDSQHAGTQDTEYIWNYSRKFLPGLEAALVRDCKDREDSDPKKIRRNLELFIECCRAVGYILATYEVGHIRLQTERVDAEYLISNLFGLPTGIQGFDTLFGGGGLILNEGGSIPQADKLGGRAVLILGRFGTGKTLLSLQLAIEVARKGGLAWVMPLEQTAEECLYSLESMRLLPENQSVIIAKTVDEALRVLQHRTDEKGALIILKTVKDSFDSFLAAFAENARLMERYPLRLISADPINSIIIRDDTDPTVLREQTMKTMGEIKQTGTNIMLVAEEATDHKDLLLYEQNIADTVIRLSVDNRHAYMQRFFEIRKSRLQREQRGEHYFSISSGDGINIFPSSAAVAARLRPRSVRALETEIKFNLPSLDEILGRKAIAIGDVIVLQGSGGSFKTPVGLLFLLGSDFKKSYGHVLPRRSLLIAARDEASTIRHMLKHSFVAQHIHAFKPAKRGKDIIIRTIPHGYVNPGYILQRIQHEFSIARLKGYWIDRVMVDNVGHWEMANPFVREDETFGDTLVDRLRRQGTTSLLTSGELLPDMKAMVQRQIIDSADCVIRFENFQFAGMHRSMLRVLKTRGMNHRRESFELTLGQNGIEVQSTSSLLRVMQGGDVKPIKVRLFLHSETDAQEKYNRRLLNSVKAVLAPEARIVEPQEVLYVSTAKALGSSSALDELQVVQLDEFQTPNSTDITQSSMLYSFSANQWDDESWTDFVPRMEGRIRNKKKGFIAVPFYGNLSLLAYRRSVLNDRALDSWDSLVKESESWKPASPDSPSIFFDYPRTTCEDFNSLFFEILSSLEKPPFRSGECALENWLRCSKAVEAGRLYRQLCRPAYLADKANSLEVLQTEAESNPKRKHANAVVWRHWYSTLNQMMSEISPETRGEIEVRPLPSGVTVAGEWYLAIPAYSAAPDVGLEVIKLLTSREAELERVRLGIGLPTRATFYGQGEGRAVDTRISPYFSMNIRILQSLVQTAFKRSELGCYSQLSETLSNGLKNIIEISDQDTNKVEDEIRAVYGSLEARISFIGADKDCSKCSFGKPFKRSSVEPM